MIKDKEKLRESKKRKRYYVKQKINEYKSDGCSLCGYNKCIDALEFHHVGEDKQIEISKARTYAMLKREIEKCILVCANCHREIHAGRIEGLVDINTVKTGNSMQGDLFL